MPSKTVDGTLPRLPQEEIQEPLVWRRRSTTDTGTTPFCSGFEATQAFQQNCQIQQQNVHQQDPHSWYQTRVPQNPHPGFRLLFPSEAKFAKNLAQLSNRCFLKLCLTQQKVAVD